MHRTDPLIAAPRNHRTIDPEVIRPRTERRPAAGSRDLGPLAPWTTLLPLLALFVLAAIPADARQAGDDELRIDSVEVTEIALERPARIKDAAGKTKSYEQLTRIVLHGRFPSYRAEPFELFFGDRRVEEYGGDRRHLQIIVYDSEVVEAFEGGEIHYRWPRGEKQSLGVAFSRHGLQRLDSKPDPRP